MLRHTLVLAAFALSGCQVWSEVTGDDGPASPVPPPPEATTERATPEKVVTINQIGKQGVGAAIGTLTISDSPAGLRIVPNLKGLPPGPHGFHVHQNPSCAPAEKEGKMTAGEAAGGHYDPDNTGKHLGPMGEGHKGDLPVLNVAADGTATAPMTAPRLMVADVEGRAFVIHEAGDNFSDSPKPLGGGGARIACGIAR